MTDFPIDPHASPPGLLVNPKTGAGVATGGNTPMAKDGLCEHHYETRILGGHPIAVRACILCHTPDWADLREQAAELYRWGWQEGRDGKAARETLSAYDQPREAVADAALHARRAHPDFEYRTTTGPRKRWDEAGVPPADENGDPDPTWERNTDAGRDGWERWDYTEESYWRRRKTPQAATNTTGTCIHPDGYNGECPCPTSCDCCKDTPALHFHLAPSGLREQIVAALDDFPVAYWTPGSIASRVMPLVGAAFDEYRDAINAEQPARTKLNNPATSSDTAGNSALRGEPQAAIEDEIYEYRERTMFWEEGGVTTEIARLATRGAMEVRDRELEKLRTKVAEFDHIINWHTTCASCARILDSSYVETMRAETAEQRLRAADFTASHWHQAAIDRDDIPSAHAIACIRAALSGETRADQLGIDDTLHDAFRAALQQPAEQPAQTATQATEPQEQP